MRIHCKQEDTSNCLLFLLTKQTEQNEQRNHSKIKRNPRLRLLCLYAACLAFGHLQILKGGVYLLGTWGGATTLWWCFPQSPPHRDAQGPGQEHHLPQRWLPRCPSRSHRHVAERVWRCAGKKRRTFGQRVTMHPAISGGSVSNRFL